VGKKKKCTKTIINVPLWGGEKEHDSKLRLKKIPSKRKKKKAPEFNLRPVGNPGEKKGVHLLANWISLR